MQVPSYIQFILRYFHAVGWSEENNTKKPLCKSHKKQNKGNNLCIHKYIKFKDWRKTNFMKSGMYKPYQPVAICLTLQQNLHCFVQYHYITH